MTGTEPCRALVSMLLTRRGRGQDWTREAVLLTATRGLYMARRVYDCGACWPCESGRECERPAFNWSLFARCGWPVTHGLMKQDARALAARLGDVGVDWTADEPTMLARRDAPDAAWRQAAALVHDARFGRLFLKAAR